MIRAHFTIDASHASLPGHFPGRPVVPGVVLLDRVAAMVEHEGNARIAKLQQVKFLRPLLPNERAELVIERETNVPTFVIRCGDDVVAKGTFEVTS
ncbi:MAG TPA: hydroxymyristoyl-ACP dehydratase [Rudaea sp.]|jgi:3-hydroxymyristoyl/3-hydroxydecanoyl-(acyl carrier protein) dehydratase|nr:hydroxymyristoyl-ACP dehydratase [Rudaea sp.]